MKALTITMCSLLVLIGCFRNEDKSKFEFCQNSKNKSNAIFIFHHLKYKVYPNISPMGGEPRWKPSENWVELGTVDFKNQKFNKIITKQVPNERHDLSWSVLNWSDSSAVILELSRAPYGSIFDFTVYKINFINKSIAIHPMNQYLHEISFQPWHSKFMDSTGNIAFVANPYNNNPSRQDKGFLWLEKLEKLIELKESDGSPSTIFTYTSNKGFVYLLNKEEYWASINLESGNVEPIGQASIHDEYKKYDPTELNFNLGRNGALDFCSGNVTLRSWNRPRYGFFHF